MVLIVDFVKKYWKVLAVVALLLFFALRTNSAQKVLEATIESNNSQIETLKKNHDDEIKKRNEITIKYQQEIKDIENKYKQQTELLQQERNKKIKIVVKYFYSDPEIIKKKVTDLYGFKYEISQ